MAFLSSVFGKPCPFTSTVGFMTTLLVHLCPMADTSNSVKERSALACGLRGPFTLTHCFVTIRDGYHGRGAHLLAIPEISERKRPKVSLTSWSTPWWLPSSHQASPTDILNITPTSLQKQQRCGQVIITWPIEDIPVQSMVYRHLYITAILGEGFPGRSAVESTWCC